MFGLSTSKQLTAVRKYVSIFKKETMATQAEILAAVTDMSSKLGRLGNEVQAVVAQVAQLKADAAANVTDPAIDAALATMTQQLDAINAQLPPA